MYREVSLVLDCNAEREKPTKDVYIFLFYAREATEFALIICLRNCFLYVKFSVVMTLCEFFFLYVEASH